MTDQGCGDNLKKVKFYKVKLNSRLDFFFVFDSKTKVNNKINIILIKKYHKFCYVYRREFLVPFSLVVIVLCSL